jgi:hypothetical protein
LHPDALHAEAQALSVRRTLGVIDHDGKVQITLVFKES